MLNFKSSPSNARVASINLGTNKVDSVTIAALQTKVMRFADEYVARVSQAADEMSERTATPDGRLLALKWKLGQATSAYVDATGPNPVLNALDMLVLVSLARMVVEDYAVGQVFGDAALPLLKVHRQIESDAWSLASGGVLKPNQQQELRALIQEWREKNPDQRYIGAIRFQEFVAALGKSPRRESSRPNSLFSLLFIDPMAGMDPTTAAIEETRQLAERAMYYTQRMPTLLNWQTEVLAYQLAVQPETRQVLSNAQRLASAAEAFGEASKQFPQQLAAALASEETKARQLLGETRQTLNAADQMAGTVNVAIKSLNEFVRFVTPTNSASVTPGTNSRPFNVLDYGTAATQVAGAAKELNSLLTMMNEATPQLARLSEQATARADLMLNRAFKLGLVLVVIFLAGLVLAGLIYRALTRR